MVVRAERFLANRERSQHKRLGLVELSLRLRHDTHTHPRPAERAVMPRARRRRHVRMGTHVSTARARPARPPTIPPRPLLKTQARVMSPRRARRAHLVQFSEVVARGCDLWVVCAVDLLVDPEAPQKQLLGLVVSGHLLLPTTHHPTAPPTPPPVPATHRSPTTRRRVREPSPSPARPAQAPQPSIAKHTTTQDRPETPRDKAPRTK